MDQELLSQAAQQGANLTVTFQMFFNVAIGFISFVGGIAMNRLFTKLDKLTDQDERLSKDITDLSVALPSKYVMKEDLQRLSDAIFDKLDKIDAKLDVKQDK